MRSRYKTAEDGGVHFLTMTIVAWLPVFTDETPCGIVVDAVKFCRANKGLQVYGYVIMDNHLHFVAEAPELPRVLQSLKRHTARELLAWAERSGKGWLMSQFAYHKAAHKTQSLHQVWQEGAHPQIIQGDAMLHQKLEYIHNNPVRRGYVDLPEHWRRSSARNYLLGQPSVMEIDPLPE